MNNKKRILGFHEICMGSEISKEAVQLGQAIEKWRKQTGRIRPSDIELFRIIKGLGYEKVPKLQMQH